MNPSGGDGLPWYRHVWPWFIVVLLGSAVLGSVATVVVAFRGRDPLVRDDWYARGVSVNRSLELLERARQRGIRAELTFAPSVDGGRVEIALRGRGLEGVDRLSLMLSHATRSEQDRSVELDRSAPGRYEAALAAPIPGRYYATIEPASEPGHDTSLETGSESGWRLSRAFYAGAAPTVLLGDGG